MSRTNRLKRSDTIVLSLLVVLLLGIFALLLVHISHHGNQIYLDSGLRFEPKALAKALILLSLLIVPFPLTAWVDRRYYWRTRWLAPIASLCVLVAFPFSFKIHLWQPASHPDGSPMYDFSRERVKSTYASFGYRPLWRGKSSSGFPYEGYGVADSGTRLVTHGNFLWREELAYGLNRKGWLEVEDKEPDKVYECVFLRTSHLLGFYLLDRRGSELEYLPESDLPKDQCRRIERPKTDL